MQLIYSNITIILASPNFSKEIVYYIYFQFLLLKLFVSNKRNLFNYVY